MVRINLRMTGVWESVVLLQVDHAQLKIHNRRMAFAYVQCVA